jgi:hypothetical protein
MRDFSEARFNRNVVGLVKLGPGAVAEFLDELGWRHTIRVPIETLLAEFVERLTPEMLEFTGGDSFPTRPSLRLIRGGRP